MSALAELNQPINYVDAYVGKRVRERRQRLGWTLMDLAQRMGVSHQQVQKYEQGTTRISASALYQLSQIFQTSQDYFFIGMDTEETKTYISDHATIDLTRAHGLSMVLVEDDAADELLLRKALEGINYEIKIHALHDGDSAIAFLKQTPEQNFFPRPDIIILDLNIPKRNGHLVLREIKRDRDLQEIPVIILTNSLSKKEMINVYKSGASGYICKSFDFEHFRQQIINILNYWAHTVVLPQRC